VPLRRDAVAEIDLVEPPDLPDASLQLFVRHLPTSFRGWAAAV
jgi:hypothetical protein